MEYAVLDLTPPSMENTLPVIAVIDVNPVQQQPEIAGQAVVDPIPLNEEFKFEVSSTPQRDERKNTSATAEKCCKRLQIEKRKLKKQVLKLRKQLAEMEKNKR